MKSYRKELFFHLPSRRGLVNITPDVEDALRESGIREGFVLVNAMILKPGWKALPRKNHMIGIITTDLRTMLTLI